MALLKTVQEVMNERVNEGLALAKDEFAPSLGRTEDATTSRGDRLRRNPVARLRRCEGPLTTHCGRSTLPGCR